MHRHARNPHHPLGRSTGDRRKGREDMATENGSTRTGLAALLAKGTVATIALGAGAVAVSTLAFPAAGVGQGSSALVIKTEHVGKVGTVLATGTGLTLYRYTVDPAGKATCTGACAKVWPLSCCRKASPT